MITNYYNASNNYSAPIRKDEPKPYEQKQQMCENHPVKSFTVDNDKVLLLGILVVLYITDCSDKWLMLALLYLAFG